MLKLLSLLAVYAVASCFAAMTKGTIQVKAPVSDKTFTLTTEFDSFDGRIMVSEGSQEPALQVQMDIERAKTTESDIEILNGFWIDLYPYLGIANNQGFDATWYPPYAPLARMVNVQQTVNATLIPKENAHSVCNPNPLVGLPLQASAIWKFDPEKKGLLLPTFLAPNGTRLPAQIHGGLYEGQLGWYVYGHGRPLNGASELLEFYFTPDDA